MYAVVVPFRSQSGIDRESHLETFLSQRFPGDPQIFIVHQHGEHQPFNRGFLLNAGFQFAAATLAEKLTHVWLHDVDLIPRTPSLMAQYAIPPPDDSTVVHLASCWKRYDSSTYFGGVVGMTPSAYLAVNGYPNNFFGWGGEDDELRKRVVRNKFAVLGAPPDAIYDDLENMDLNEKLQFLRARPHQKNLEKWELAAQHEATWRTNGVNQVPQDAAKPWYEQAKRNGSVTHLTAKIVV